MNKKIENLILETCIKIARRGEGSLIVLGGKPKYQLLVKQDFKYFNIKDNLKLFESLALVDGSVIIDERGIVKCFGAMIETKKVYNNFGTRHSAGFSASLRGSTVFLVSEEDRKVRIFKRGKMIMQLDPLEKNIEKNVSEAVVFLEATGMGALGTIGTAVLFPTVGITLIPGIILFGGFYYIVKNIDKLKNLTRKNL